MKNHDDLEPTEDDYAAVSELFDTSIVASEDAFPKMSRPVIDGAVAQISAQKGVAEVFGAIVSARQFPRDQFTAVQRIKEACKRKSLASEALYKFPRGGKPVTGPSIRLAEVLAQQWGNIDFGMREVASDEDGTVVESYAWDLETNSRATRVFRVTHKKKAGGQIKSITDPRDIYEHAANMGSRRLRAAILQIIPRDVTDIAVAEVRRTIAGGGEGPLADRVRKMVEVFAPFGVSVESIEDYLGHKLDCATEDELTDLRIIFTTIKDGQGKAADYFDRGKMTGNERAKAIESRFKTDKEATE